MPSNDLLMTSCARFEACVSRPLAVPRSLAISAPSKFPPALFLIVGMTRVPVIAARIVGSSAPELCVIDPSEASVYQPGFDSVIAPAWRCTLVSAFGSQVGIHALIVYAWSGRAAAAANNSTATNRDR